MRRTANIQLQRRMLLAGFSSPALGDRVGLSAKQIRAIQGGVIPHPSNQHAIAEVLDCTVFDLWPLRKQKTVGLTKGYHRPRVAA